MKIIFRPKTKSVDDILTTAYARKVWEDGKGDIVAALEQTSGLKFKQSVIRAVSGTFEAMHSGWPATKAMALPLKYHIEGNETPHYMGEIEYLGLVSHELAHHLLLEHNIIAPKGPDHDLWAHQHIYLFLIDAWRQAYDREKTARLVANEPSYARDHYITRSFRCARRLSRARCQGLMHYLVEHRSLPDDIRL